MKLRMRLGDVRWALGIFGAGVLGYCGFVLADAWCFQREATVAFAEELAPAVAAPAAAPVRAAAERIWGRVAVERLGLSVIVLEGTSRDFRAQGYVFLSAARRADGGCSDGDDACWSVPVSGCIGDGSEAG